MNDNFIEILNINIIKYQDLDGKNKHFYVVNKYNHKYNHNYNNEYNFFLNICLLST